MLFPVIDKFQSGFDTKTGCSTGFQKQLQEGRRKISSDLNFDYAAGQADAGGEEPGEGHDEAADGVDSGVRDGLAFGDLLRGIAADGGGADFRFPLADSMRTVTVTMKVEAKEEIKTPAGTFQTMRVQPTADEGVVKNRGKIWIWYTDDARHMPVQMRASLFWGTITAQLQIYEDEVRQTDDDSNSDRDRSSDPEQFVTVARFIDPVEAQMAKGLLESAGMECFLQGENANSCWVWRFARDCWSQAGRGGSAGAAWRRRRRLSRRIGRSWRKDGWRRLRRPRPRAVVCLSGGMDSGSAPRWRHGTMRFMRVHFSYGQRTEAKELRSARRSRGLSGVRELLPAEDGSFRRIGGSALTDEAIAVPEGIGG